MGYGVIGSPTDSGSVSLGSSPSTPATEVPIRWKGLRIGRLPWPDRCTHLVGPARAPLCSGLARRPLKAVARVRIPSGLPGIHHNEPVLLTIGVGQLWTWRWVRKRFSTFLTRGRRTPAAGLSASRP